MYNILGNIVLATEVTHISLYLFHQDLYVKIIDLELLVFRSNIERQSNYILLLFT